MLEIRLYEERARGKPDENRAGLAVAIHEEIDRLPDRFRIAVVLCEPRRIDQPSDNTRNG
jgi:hypothetical protein